MSPHASKAPVHSSSEFARRQEKKRKQCESLKRAFGDPLAVVASRPCNSVLRKYSSEIAKKDDEIKETIRKISSESEESLGPFDKGRVKRAENFIDKRQKAAAALDKLTTEKLNFIKRLEKSGEIDKTASKREIAELEVDDSLILRERYAFYENRARMLIGMLANNGARKLGEAYLAALSAFFPIQPAQLFLFRKGSAIKVFRVISEKCSVKAITQLMHRRTGSGALSRAVIRTRKL